MKRKARQPTARERELAAEWDRIMKRHSAPLELGAKAKGLKASGGNVVKYGISAPPKSTTPETDVGRWQRKMCGVTAPPEQKIYTGTACKGVATMHKSNSVPVFTDQEAVDVAKMRRN